VHKTAYVHHVSMHGTTSFAAGGVAQDYENYLNSREAINALMAANVSLTAARYSCRQALVRVKTSTACYFLSEQLGG
jgi:hypothetical protein